MLKEIKSKSFANGKVYVLHTLDGYPIETTDTFLPYYTKDCINEHINELKDYHLGSREDRWMIGVSVMSGCPVHCKFCSTGKLQRWRNLTADEIIEQVDFIIKKNTNYNPDKSLEFKINFTRMGEYSLNKENIQKAVIQILKKYKNAHIFISTIGVKGDTFEWVKDNITLQVSLHSLSSEYRDFLIPFKNKMTIEELGAIRTNSKLKTTLNLTLTNDEILNVEELKKYFDPAHFFIKLSPLNTNEISQENNITTVIEELNLM